VLESIVREHVRGLDLPDDIVRRNVRVDGVTTLQVVGAQSLRSAVQRTDRAEMCAAIAESARRHPGPPAGTDFRPVLIGRYVMGCRLGTVFPDLRWDYDVVPTDDGDLRVVRWDGTRGVGNSSLLYRSQFVRENQ
jgi:hypothetical protein